MRTHKNYCMSPRRQLKAMWRCAVILLLVNLTDAIAMEPFGLQSNRASRDLFAGSMVYDSKHQTLYVTGTMISSAQEVNCYLASIRLPTATGVETPDWQFIDKLDHGDTNKNAEETCFSITQLVNHNGDDRKKRLVITGSTEFEGLLTSDVRPDDGVVQPLVYGMVMDVGVDVSPDPNDMAHLTSSKLQGGTIINNGTVQYPLGVVTTPPKSDDDANVDEYIFVASLVESSLSSANTPSDGIDLARYGYDSASTLGNYSVLLQKYKVRSATPSSQNENILAETMERIWSHVFTPVHSESVSLSSSILSIPKENMLLIAGSTAGYGFEFGANQKSVDDVDGFITKVNMDDGTVPMPKNQSLIGSMQNHLNSYSLRIDTQPFRDDYVSAMCHHDNDVYVVGYTTGSMVPRRQKSNENGRRRENEQVEYHGFVQKYDLFTLDVEWKDQLSSMDNDGADTTSSNDHGPIGVKAIACGVTQDGNHIYVAGQILNGGLLKGVTDISSSHGGDDIFVAYYDTRKGDLLFTKQMGTAKDDHLAWGNGALVVIEEEEQESSSSIAVLFGDTRGSFMRNRDEENDDERNIFILSISSDGQHKKLLQQGGEGPSSEEGDDSSSDSDPSSTSSEEGNNSSSDSDPSSTSEATNEQNLRDGKKKSSKGGMIAGITMFIICVVALVSGAIYWRRRQSQKEISYDDNEDDLRSIPSVQ